jgi:hypothetical protein
MVLDLHQRAIGGGRGQAKNRGGVNPGMPGQDAVGIPRANNHSGQLGRVQNSISRFNFSDNQPEAGQQKRHCIRRGRKRQR